MNAEMRAAKLAKLIELEGFEDDQALFAAAISDSVCPAICCKSECAGVRLHGRNGAGSGSRLVRDVRARDARFRARAWGDRLMSASISFKVDEAR